jgi:hypothetical protein
MPVKSQAQRRFMFAVEEGKVPGVAKSVGKDFISASKGLTGLPEKITPPKPPKGSVVVHVHLHHE